MICPAIQNVQPNASNIQKDFFRQSRVTVLMSRAPLTRRGIRQRRMFAAEIRAAPAGTHSQTATYPPSRMSQAVATYQFPRKAGFIVRLIVHSIVWVKQVPVGEG